MMKGLIGIVILCAISQLAFAELCPEPSALRMNGMQWEAKGTGSAGNYKQGDANSLFVSPITMGEKIKQTPKTDIKISYLGAFWWGFESPMVCMYDLEETHSDWAIPITMVSESKIYDIDQHTMGKGWNCHGDVQPASCSCFSYGKTKDCEYTALAKKTYR
ncbi:MAG: hypothetical protein CMF50_03250 [Legionellales bacterium]|nr:hypothetical protein [Legionellales bacterium]|tara:strand:- start:11136 stop:11618 length:483 start_codon:yes stop_codon:yes gene_type:complete